MITYTTPTWGYKILSNSVINFYHVLLPKTKLTILTNYLPKVQNVTYQKDGSLTIEFTSGHSLPIGLQKLISFFDQQTHQLLENPVYYYSVTPGTRERLKPWFLSFEGCLAILLLSDEKTKQLLPKDWEYVNSGVGGLYFSPYILFLYSDHPQIIKPITTKNSEARRIIEQKTCHFVKELVKRVEESAAGLEGIAMASVVVDRTKISKDSLSEIIDRKSLSIQPSHQAPFLDITTN